jgi:PHP domain/Carbohydrate binding domain (family 11)
LRRGRRLVIAAVVLLLAGLALRIFFWKPLSLVDDSAPNDGLTRLSGVVHVHTTFSDGGGTPEEVMAAAQQAGLSFLIITDHNNLGARNVAGYHGRLLVLIGSELSSEEGHIVALGIPDPPFHFPPFVRDALEDVSELGGVSFAAHPMSPIPDFRWKRWDLPGSWGIEVLNGDSEWREAGSLRLFWTLCLYGLNHRYAMLTSMKSPDATLTKWDDLLAKRDVPAIVGTDAHSRVPFTKKFSLRFPSYRVLFDLTQNHVLLQSPLTGRADTDSRSVIEALAKGQNYVGLDALAPAGDFYFDAQRNDQHWIMGQTVPAGSPVLLRAGGKFPQGSMVTLLRNGQSLLRQPASLHTTVSDPGVYRVEVRVPAWDVPWILSNPIYLFDSKAAEARINQARWPEPPAPPAPVETLDRFDGSSIFQTASDSHSAVNRQVIDPGAGPDGTNAGKLSFHLGTPEPDHPDVYCALVNIQKRDLSGKKGLVFSIRGDGQYRIWLQVRDANPASSDEGSEWWYVSVRTSQQWRRIVAPFADFRSINKHTDGKLNLDKVVGIVFVMDKGSMKTGTSGNLWIADLGVY